jgi:hypothetical protein
MSSWILDTLRRVVCDLGAYQNGEPVPLDVLESFLIALERVYRELLMKESISALTSGEREACELIRNSMTVLLNLRDVQIRNEGNGSVPSNLIEMENPIIGRPKFCIGLEQLSMLLEHRFSVPQIADMLGVSVSTIRRRMTEYGLSVAATYSSLSDDDLDTLTKEIQQIFPMCGNRQMMGQLLARGIRVQQYRVRESQRRIDPEGSMLRRLNSIHRRVYKVYAPRALYHIDGNHKLIRLILCFVA